MSKGYVLHSMVRRVKTRTQRAMSPKRHRFVQRIGGGAITVRRGRHRGTTVSEEMLEEHFDEIKKRWEAGMIEVRTPTGEPVDLNTMETSEPEITKPLPDKVLAEEDLGNSPEPAYEEGKGHLEEVAIPTLVTEGNPEGEEPPPVDAPPLPEEEL